MGTKIHYRSYFPLHDTMGKLNAEAGNNWPPVCINKTLNENFYNGCLLSPLNVYSEYDREMLKQTMLEHEAIFRKQVNELHRLYSIQKDLMAEFQKNSPSRSYKHEAPSRTISYASQVQSDYATSILQISQLHAMHNSQKKEKSRYNDDIISPINFFRRNQQSSSFFRETDVLQIVAEPETNFRNFPKTTLDLTLLDCGYTGDTERLEEEFPTSSSLNRITCSRISNGDFDIELKLKLANGSGPSEKDDVCKLNYHYNKSPFSGLVFSNEPNKNTFFKGTSDSFSHPVSGPRTQKEEHLALSYSLSSNRLTPQNAFPKDRFCCERTSSNVFQEVKEETSRGILCYNETGKSFPLSFPSSISDKDKNFERIKLNVNEARGIISTDHNGPSTQFVDVGGDHFQIRNLDLGKPPVLPNSLSSSLNFEGDVTSSPLFQSSKVLSGGKNNASRPFSAIPSFKGTNNVNNCSPYTPTKVCNTVASSLQVCSDLNSPVRFENSSLSYLNDEILCQSHSKSQLRFQFTSINLNEKAEGFFSDTQNPVVSQQKAASSADGKCDGQNRPPSQVDLGFGKIDQVFERKTENVADISLCNLEVLLSSPHKGKSEINISPLSESLNTAKCIGPNYEQNLVSSSNKEELVMDELRHASMPCDIKMYMSEKSPSVENNISNSRSYIDLNSEFPIKDDSDTLDISTKVQAYFPSNHPDPISVSRDVTLIDLEAPDNSIISMTLQEELCSHEMLIEKAAEDIVKLSSDGFKEKEDIHSSLSPSKDVLYLFAEIVLSEENVMKGNEPQEDGFDLFELMNLQLEEMKPEKLWCRPHIVKNTEVDKRSKVSIFLAKPRRAQGRKRRQKKDFQKDIIPTLTTLSRQEITKDLQAIGELLTASGMPWQVEKRRRRTWRNGVQPRASRKRRQSNASASVAMVQTNPPTAMFMAGCDTDNPAFEVDRQDIIGWGKTTRRCRSQRCHPIGVSATLM